MRSDRSLGFSSCETAPQAVGWIQIASQAYGVPMRGDDKSMSVRFSRNPFSRFLRILGPGLITGAADDDPSGIATYSQTGAQFGYGQLWIALFTLPLMTAIQEACARIGLVTGKGIVAIVRERYGARLTFAVVLLVLVANTINIGADLGLWARRLLLSCR
jgi:Mn2+/Fe2+ NRAMP family transporter